MPSPRSKQKSTNEQQDQGKDKDLGIDSQRPTDDKAEGENEDSKDSEAAASRKGTEDNTNLTKESKIEDEEDNENPSSVRDGQDGGPSDSKALESRDSEILSPSGGQSGATRMKQKSKDDAKLEAALQQLLGENQVEGQAMKDYKEFFKAYKLEDIVRALFTQGIPPFNTEIEPEMARKCANFLCDGENCIRLASNDELAVAANIDPGNMSRWRKEATAKKFCDFLGTCKDAPSSDAGQENEGGSQLNTGKHPKMRAGEGYIYVMQDKPDRFKIGCSQDPNERLKHAQTFNIVMKLVHEEQVDSRMHAREAAVHNDPDIKKYHKSVEGLAAREWYEGCTLQHIIEVIKRHA